MLWRRRNHGGARQAETRKRLITKVDELERHWRRQRDEPSRCEINRLRDHFRPCLVDAMERCLQKRDGLRQGSVHRWHHCGRAVIQRRKSSIASRRIEKRGPDRLPVRSVKGCACGELCESEASEIQTMNRWDRAASGVKTAGRRHERLAARWRAVSLTSAASVARSSTGGRPAVHGEGCANHAHSAHPSSPASRSA